MPVRGRRDRVGREQEGAVAQLGERLLCKQDVVGSIPSGSTMPAGPCLPKKHHPLRNKFADGFGCPPVLYDIVKRRSVRVPHSESGFVAGRF